MYFGNDFNFMMSLTPVHGNIPLCYLLTILSLILSAFNGCVANMQLRLFVTKTEYSKDPNKQTGKRLCMTNYTKQLSSCGYYL